MKLKIFLIGYRATGKSAVGRKLAEALGWAFRDLDAWIETQAGMSIAQMVASRGWPYFREREKEILLATGKEPGHLVVACGGGAVLHEDIWPQLRREGLVVWLRATPETIVQRLETDAKTATQRPRLTSAASSIEEVHSTLAAREPLYQKLSDVAIDTETRRVEDVVADIVKENKKTCQETPSVRSSA